MIIFGLGLNTYKSYMVTPPWRLGYVEKKVSKHGVKYLEKYNLLTSDLNPTEFSNTRKPLPRLELDYEQPFWHMDGKLWKLFKKRIIGYTSKSVEAEGLTPVKDEDVENLKARLMEKWLND